MAFQTPPIEIVRTLVDDEIKRQIQDLEDRLNAQVDDAATRIINALGGPRTIWEQDQRNKLYAQIDGLTRAKVGIDYAHHEIHGGSSFHANANISTAGNLTLAFKTPPGKKRAHMEFHFRTENDAHLRVLEGATWTTATGSAVSISNHFRGSNNESVILGDQSGTFTANEMVQDPTGLAGGTEIFNDYVYASNLAATSTPGRNEWVLEPDQTYYVNIVSDSGNQAMWLGLDWYEHTDA